MGRFFFLGFSLSVALSKYWLITKPEAVIAQNEIEIKNVFNIGKVNRVLPIQKINNQLAQLLNLIVFNNIWILFNASRPLINISGSSP